MELQQPFDKDNQTYETYEGTGGDQEQAQQEQHRREMTASYNFVLRNCHTTAIEARNRGRENRSKKNSHFASWLDSAVEHGRNPSGWFYARHVASDEKRRGSGHPQQIPQQSASNCCEVLQRTVPSPVGQNQISCATRNNHVAVRDDNSEEDAARSHSSLLPAG